MALIPIINVQDVKNWCRIDTDGDDALLSVLIASAQEQAEAYCNQSFLPTCPTSIKQAVALWAADLYANREGQTVGEQTFYRILAPFRQAIV